MTTIPTTHRALVSLSLPKTVPALITYAQQIVDAMTGNASFPTPSPALTAITQGITDLQTAEASALSRVKGAVQGRNDKRAALVKLLQLLKSYIQSVADRDAETAPTVIRGAGVAVKKAPVRRPRTFTVAAGTLSGSAKLSTESAGARSSYLWQTSIDGGKTWVDAPATVQAKTTVSGLAAGSTVLFRYRPVTKTGQGDWVPPVSLLVQ
ncbi:MAG TPA: hypothetical protein VHS09_09015 [Polyangiaceae bacterium]|jgi:hypothetical protein|nr:hypothetical protein [Polyangiaceae bacterium]